MGLHPLIGNTSWGFYVRILQFIFAALVMSLAAYTLSIAPGWREDRFTVAAVYLLNTKSDIRVHGVFSPYSGFCPLAWLIDPDLIIS